MVRKIGITEARRRLASVVDSVRYHGESYIILRRGREAAAVVPVQVYRRWRTERDELFEVVREIQAANPSTDPDQAIQDVLQAQRSVRRPAEKRSASLPEPQGCAT